VDNVVLGNADGVIVNSSLGSKRPYIWYDEAVASGFLSSAKEWWFLVPSGVKMFDFTVQVEANTAGLVPPEAVDGNLSGGLGSPNVMVRTVTELLQQGFLDGPLSQALFFGPNDVDSDASGNLYLVETVNRSVRRIGTDGIVTTVAGVVGSGSGTADGLGTLAKFTNPQSLSVSADGTVIYVGDGSAVRRIELTGIDPKNPAHWTVSTIAGVPTTPGRDDGTGNLASFATVSGIVSDPFGNLFLAEGENRVRMLRNTGGDPMVAANWLVSLVAGDNSAILGGSGTTDATGPAARFNNPQSIAIDSLGNLYVADEFNHRIRKITSPGRFGGGIVTTLAGSTVGYNDSNSGSTAQFNFPQGVTVDSAGFVYVADTSNFVIRRISPAGVVRTVAGGATLQAYVDGRGDLARFDFPTEIDVDPAGNLYVIGLDGQGIRKVERLIDTGIY